MTPRLSARDTLRVSALLAAAQLGAVDIVKTNDATALNLAAAWVGGVAPGASDIALFDSTMSSGTGLNPVIGGNLSWGGIRFVGPAANVGIYNTGTGTSGNILTLGSGGIDMSAATKDLTLRARTALGANQTWTVAASRTLAVDGWGTSNADGRQYDFNLGGFTLTKAGAGTLNVLNGYRLANGRLEINAGTVQIAANTNRVSGLKADATVSVNTGASFGVQNNIGTTYTEGGVTKQSADAILWEGKVILNGGRFNFSYGATPGALNLGGIIEAAAGTTSDFAYVTTAANSGNAFQRDVSATLTGTGTINFRSETTTRLIDRVTLLGDNSAFAGKVIVNSTVASSNRTLRLGAAQSGSAAATWNIAADNTLEVHGVDVALGALESTGTLLNSGSAQSTVTVGALGTSTNFGGTLNGGTAGLRLVKTGAGTLTLGGANTALSGGTLLRQGALAFTNVAAFAGGALTLGDASTAAGTLTLHFTENNTAARTVATDITVAASAATEVRIGRTATSTSGLLEQVYSGQITLGRDVTLFNATAGSGQTRFSGKITGTGDVRIAFLGTGSNPVLVINNPVNGTNDFVGHVRIASNSLLQLGVNTGGMTDVIPNASRILFEAATGTFRLSGTSETVAGLHSLVAGGGTVAINRTTTGGGSVTLALAQTSTAESLDFGGLITDQAANAESWRLNLTKSGAGTQRLSGTNSSYAGITTLVGGVLEVAKLANGGLNSSIGKSAADATNLVFDGGTLRYVGSGDTSDRLFTLSAGGALSADGTGALVLSGASTADNTLAVQLTDTPDTGTLALAKSGAGTWILSGANTHTGGTTVSAGILRLAHLAALGTGAVTVTGGTLDLAGLAATNTITLASGGTLAGLASYAGSLVLGDGAAVGGTLAGTVSTGASASARLTLAAPATFTGTFKGVGTVSGALATVTGTHAPGNSPGLQTFEDGLAYGASSVLQWEFVGDTLAVRGADYDAINVTGGSLTVASGATVSILNLSQVDYTAAAWDANRTFSLIAVSGTGSYNPADTFLLSITQAGLNPAEGNWSLQHTSGGVDLKWTSYAPVPEPSTYGLILGVLSLVSVSARRRRKRLR